MKYNLNWVKALYESGTRIKYLLYWGHRPNNDGSIGKGCLSQWWEAEFEVNNKIYKTSEHWMMARKAELFGDNEILEKIYLAKTPKEAKTLGRKVKKFGKRIDTESSKQGIIINSGKMKF